MTHVSAIHDQKPTGHPEGTRAPPKVTKIMPSCRLSCCLSCCLVQLPPQLLAQLLAQVFVTILSAFQENLIRCNHHGHCFCPIKTEVSAMSANCKKVVVTSLWRPKIGPFCVTLCVTLGVYFGVSRRRRYYRYRGQCASAICLFFCAPFGSTDKTSYPWRPKASS